MKSVKRQVEPSLCFRTLMSQASQAPRLAGDLAPGSAGVQSSGLTHWDRFKSQWNLTSVIGPEPFTVRGSVAASQYLSVLEKEK